MCVNHKIFIELKTEKPMTAEGVAIDIKINSLIKAFGLDIIGVSEYKLVGTLKSATYYGVWRKAFMFVNAVNGMYGVTGARVRYER